MDASLSLPLHLIGAAERGSALVFYAGNAGAFVDLAADLTHGLDVLPGVLALDEHLHLPTEQSNLDGLSRIDQAIGMLIGRGHTPDEAQVELRRLAEWDSSDATAAARKMLTGPR